MDVVGVICEYDPFHAGHARQFALIREQLPNAAIVCLMSGCFTQRGMPALHAPAARARAALRAGADGVLELPCAFSVRDAEHFALGGVSILSELGFVTHLCFGAEDELSRLSPAAQLIEHPTEAFRAALHAELQRGQSFASAQGAALSACLPECAEAVQKPNNILALCYLRALDRLQSPIAPMPVLRAGDYHADALSMDAFPSATAVRAAFLRGEREAASAACGWTLPDAPVCRPDALDVLLLHRLRTMTAEEADALPLSGEGLSNRLLACARESATREALLQKLKTKRYPYARLSRLCCHALLGVTEESLTQNKAPAYVRVLGMRREAALPLKQSRIPVIAKAADGPRQHPLWQLDERAYELWALGAGEPAGLLYRQGVAVEGSSR